MLTGVPEPTNSGLDSDLNPVDEKDTGDDGPKAIVPLLRLISSNNPILKPVINTEVLKVRLNPVRLVVELAGEAINAHLLPSELF